MNSRSVSTRTVVLGLAVALVGLGVLQALAARTGGSSQYAVIRWSAVGMLLVIGVVVYALRGGLED